METTHPRDSYKTISSHADIQLNADISGMFQSHLRFPQAQLLLVSVDPQRAAQLQSIGLTSSLGGVATILMIEKGMPDGSFMTTSQTTYLFIQPQMAF